MRIFFIAFFLLSLYACDNDLTTIGDNLIPNDHYVEVTRFILDETSTIIPNIQYVNNQYLPTHAGEN